MSGLDRISRLPDSMLCHILSFMPTKDAVVTSALSTRWMRVWLSVPTLYFEEEYGGDYEDHVDFIAMVYTVIVQRDVEPVQKFSLKISHPTCYCYYTIIAWVKSVIKRGVQHIELCLPNKIDLPPNILGCRTLVVLKLGGVLINKVFTNGFPSLKVLHLDEVVFDDHQCLAHFIFGCPILEELYVDDLTLTTLSNDNTITGGEFQSLNNLVSAVILFSRQYIPLKWICKVKSLRMYEESIPNYDANCTFPNLTSLELIIDHYNWSWLVDVVLRNCPNLQNFEISHVDNSNEHECEKWPQPKFVPECLSIHLRTCTLRKYKGWKCELQFSKYIMQNAKVLRTMRICSGIFSEPEAKLKVIRKLSSFPRRSAECRLQLNVK
ncbi:putative F-box domain, FBD domain, leucine-rich repeat domain, L domain-containing protein [Lupinus albus]|uniref:Putative F-box domain, FBD domain, leucine-rich repeat domain, L domain-containing protein n=1 Tax=Lupinus albus TaxID=3870 RepID=A0A6A4MYQ4_LUPAL|nr:putative F-box domain, FBD domain, leucine-rich repeat domain, L domain-containing protein [Lupinus albus]